MSKACKGGLGSVAQRQLLWISLGMGPLWMCVPPCLTRTSSRPSWAASICVSSTSVPSRPFGLVLLGGLRDAPLAPGGERRSSDRSGLVSRTLLRFCSSVVRSTLERRPAPPEVSSEVPKGGVVVAAGDGVLGGGLRLTGPLSAAARNAASPRSNCASSAFRRGRWRVD